MRIDFPGLAFAAYTYDGLGRRIEKDVDGTVTRYVYDGEDILLEYDGANLLQARYTHGLGIDEPLLMQRDQDAGGTFEPGESFVYLRDGLGSVVQLTDSVGAVVRSYLYDGFGGIVSETGTLANPYTYTGRERDAETGFYFYRARYYDPAIGRFLAEDPLGFGGGDPNLYRYVNNNPILFVDPTGLICLTSSQIGAISGATGGFVGGAVTGGLVAAASSAGNPLAILGGALGGGAVAGVGGALGGGVIGDVISGSSSGRGGIFGQVFGGFVDRAVSTLLESPTLGLLGGAAVGGGVTGLITGGGLGVGAAAGVLGAVIGNTVFNAVNDILTEANDCPC